MSMLLAIQPNVCHRNSTTELLCLRHHRVDTYTELELAVVNTVET